MASASAVSAKTQRHRASAVCLQAIAYESTETDRDLDGLLCHACSRARRQMPSGK